MHCSVSQPNRQRPVQIPLRILEVPVGWVPIHLILAVESFAARANFFFLYIREFVTYCVESGTWGGGAILVFVCGGGRPRAVAEGPRACVIMHVC